MVYSTLCATAVGGHETGTLVASPSPAASQKGRPGSFFEPQKLEQSIVPTFLGAELLDLRRMAFPTSLLTPLYPEATSWRHFADHVQVLQRV